MLQSGPRKFTADVQGGTTTLASSLALENTEPHIGLRVVLEASALNPFLTGAWIGRLSRHRVCVYLSSEGQCSGMAFQRGGFASSLTPPNMITSSVPTEYKLLMPTYTLVPVGTHTQVGPAAILEGLR